MLQQLKGVVKDEAYRHDIKTIVDESIADLLKENWPAHTADAIVHSVVGVFGEVCSEVVDADYDPERSPVWVNGVPLSAENIATLIQSSMRNSGPGVRLVGKTRFEQRKHIWQTMPNIILDRAEWFKNVACLVMGRLLDQKIKKLETMRTYSHMIELLYDTMLAKRLQEVCGFWCATSETVSWPNFNILYEDPLPNEPKGFAAKMLELAGTLADMQSGKSQLLIDLVADFAEDDGVDESVDQDEEEWDKWAEEEETEENEENEEDPPYDVAQDSQGDPPIEFTAMHRQETVSPSIEVRASAFASSERFLRDVSQDTRKRVRPVEE